jgi:hypothetical protein
MRHLHPPALLSRRRGAEVLGALLVIGALALVLALSPSDARAQGPAAAAKEAAAKEHPRVRLAVGTASPPSVYYHGKARARFQYRIGGTKARNLEIQAVRRRNGQVVKRWRRDGVRPGTLEKIRWTGSTTGGSFAGKGKYLFRVRARHGHLADRSKSKGDRNFVLHAYKFPLRASHDYGDGFGAGRGHDGQDVFARCGSELQAAHAGRVTTVGYDAGGGGNYVVISGDHSNLDYVYMHLRGSGIKAREGRHMLAGQRIGKVGESGNAVGCHLHFELWQGAYFAGGHPRSDVGSVLRRWDRWS